MKIYRIAIPIPFANDVKTLRNQKYPTKKPLQENEKFHQNTDDQDDEIQGPLRIDNSYSQKQIQNIEQKFPNAKPIGFGNMGIAYDIGNNKILKVSIDFTEFDAAKQLIKKPLDTHVTVYEVNEKDFYIIIEKIKPLTDIEKEVYIILYRIYSEFFSKTPPDTETFIQQIQKIKTRTSIKKLLNTNEFHTLIPPFVNFINKLKKYGLEPSHLDIHDDNIGLDNNGNIKILDLGMSLY